MTSIYISNAYHVSNIQILNCNYVDVEYNPNNIQPLSVDHYHNDKIEMKLNIYNRPHRPSVNLPLRVLMANWVVGTLQPHTG